MRTRTRVALGLALALSGTVACPAGREGPRGAAEPTAEARGSGSASAHDVGARCPAGMVFVREGAFRMGSDDAEPEERPVHSVTVRAFCLDRTEVAVEAYAACVARGACTPSPGTVAWAAIEDDERAFWSPFCNGLLPDKARHPVNCVDWYQADAYCRAGGGRLPSEEEWEYAARGTASATFPWGEAAPGPNLLNACAHECVAMGVGLGRRWDATFEGDDGWGTTAPVASYPDGRNALGVYDLAGNVWEWTASSWSDDYSKARGDAARAARGGSWWSWLRERSQVRAAARHRSLPGERLHDLGFRCAHEPLGPAP